MGLSCQASVPLRYSAPSIVLRVMLFAVGVPLTVGANGVAWLPFATALAVIAPEGVMLVIAPVRFAGAITGIPIVDVVVVCVVGAPDIGTVTTVGLVLTAVPAESPAGSPEVGAKLAGVIGSANVPPVTVYTMLPDTA